MEDEANGHVGLLNPEQLFLKQQLKENFQSFTQHHQIKMKKIFRSDDHTTVTEMTKRDIRDTYASIEFSLTQDNNEPSTVSIENGDEELTIRIRTKDINKYVERFNVCVTSDGIIIDGKTFTPHQLRKALR